MHYRYIKKRPASKKYFLPRFVFPRYLPLIFVIAGGLFILNVIFPILSYQFFISPQLTALLSPEAKKNVLAETTSTLDYTQASNWFPSAPKLPPLSTKITYYTLSIPKLKITDASVQIGGDDLKKSLIHWQGTAFPGQLGNAVIFGHSSLPQFFNPKNYLTIFATLPNLKNGDEILVKFDGILYKYVVEEMVEVTPDDISILEQNYNNSYLTLVTCVPPGTVFRRLVVKAKISKI